MGIGASGDGSKPVFHEFQIRIHGGPERLGRRIHRPHTGRGSHHDLAVDRQLHHGTGGDPVARHDTELL